MNKYIKDVKEFHEKFGHPVSKEIGFPDKKTQLLRVELLEEELKELRQAIEDENLVEVADAFGDIQYVLSGAILCFGLQEKFDSVFQEIHNSNMSKLGLDGKPIYREDGKILKGENYFRPNVEGILLNNHKVEIQTEKIDFVNMEGFKDCMLSKKDVFVVMIEDIIDLSVESFENAKYENMFMYASTQGYKVYMRYSHEGNTTEFAFLKQK